MTPAMQAVTTLSLVKEQPAATTFAPEKMNIVKVLFNTKSKSVLRPGSVTGGSVAGGGLQDIRPAIMAMDLAESS